MALSNLESSVEIYDVCKIFGFLPIYETAFDVVDYFKAENPQMLNGLKSIIYYDSILDDYFQKHLEHCMFGYFKQAFHPTECPAIHLYLTETFGCTIRGGYADSPIGKTRMLSDVIYYYLYGRYFLIANIINGIVVHYGNQHGITYKEPIRREKTYNLYVDYLSKQGVRTSNSIYRILYCWRILKSKKAIKDWEKMLEEKNTTRIQELEMKKKEMQEKRDSNQTGESRGSGDGG